MTDVYSPLLTQLIQALQCLPGVGTKSAQRMAFHLLDRDREGAERLANVLQNAMRGIGNCRNCRMLTELSICQICASEKRDAGQICVLETPADLLAIEQSGAYRGRYFVLMGHLSPIDGIGPRELGLELLEDRFELRHRPGRRGSTCVGMPLPVSRTVKSTVPAAASGATRISTRPPRGIA